MAVRTNNDFESTSIFDRDENKIKNILMEDDLNKAIRILDVFANIALIGATIFLTIRYTAVGFPDKLFIPTNPITWAGFILITIKLGITYFKRELKKTINNHQMD